MSSIEWTHLAGVDFKEILKYYKKRSPQGYKLVKAAVIETLEAASKNPGIFIADNLKNPLDQHVRTFTVYHIRVSYLQHPEKIIVLRLRHTSREPLEY